MTSHAPAAFVHHDLHYGLTQAKQFRPVVCVCGIYLSSRRSNPRLIYKANTRLFQWDNGQAWGILNKHSVGEIIPLLLGSG